MQKDYIRSKTNSGAMLNTDNDSLLAYKRQRNLMRNVGSQTERINKMENDINEVKVLLQQLLEKKD
jgi:hypothetical protein